MPHKPPGPSVIAFIRQSAATNSTPSPFVAVSDGSDSDLASELVINAINTSDSSVPVTIEMENSDGDLKFEKSSVTVTPGVPEIVKIWGLSPSSAEGATLVRLTGSFTDEGDTGDGGDGGGGSGDGGSSASTAAGANKKSVVTTTGLTAFQGIVVKFSGQFYSPVDTRNFFRRPSDGSGWPTAPAPLQHICVKNGTAVPADDRAGYPGIINADTGDFSSKVCFRKGDQAVVMRPWLTATADQPMVTIDEVRTAKPPDVVITADVLVGAELSMAIGRFFEDTDGIGITDLVLTPKIIVYQWGKTESLFSVSSTYDARLEKLQDSKTPRSGIATDLLSAASDPTKSKMTDWFNDKMGVAGIISQYEVVSTRHCKWPQLIDEPHAVFSSTRGAKVRDSAASKALTKWSEENPNKIRVSWEMSDFYEWNLTGTLSKGILKTPIAP